MIAEIITIEQIKSSPYGEFEYEFDIMIGKIEISIDHEVSGFYTSVYIVYNNLESFTKYFDSDNNLEEALIWANKKIKILTK
jgi:hypothetical protein